MAVWKLAPALAAGNCVVLKPAEQTPASILVLAELIADILPPGVLNIVNGFGLEAGKPLASSPRIAKIAFTGETTTGRLIMQYASQNLIPVTLELGGKSPNIFFKDVTAEDDDFFDKAIEGFVMFALNQGEVCTCPSRALIHEAIYDKFMEKALKRVEAIVQGDPLDPATMIGAQASSEQLEKILSYMDIGKQEGAEVLIGGERNLLAGDLAGGYYVQPTVFKGHNRMRIFQEEIFGPVVSVTTFKDNDEALSIANDTLYGLGRRDLEPRCKYLLPLRPRHPGRARLDQLLSCLSGARGVRRLQAVWHRSRKPFEDAGSLPADQEHARQLQPERSSVSSKILDQKRTSVALFSAIDDDLPEGSTMEDKVSATPAALELIATLQSEYGPILFHQSGGCCDGSSPMCYPQGDFIIGDQDVRLGEIGGAPVYISASQYDVWKHTELIIDVVPGRGGMFSLDNGREVRFLTRSKICMR